MTVAELIEALNAFTPQDSPLAVMGAFMPTMWAEQKEEDSLQVYRRNPLARGKGDFFLFSRFRKVNGEWRTV